MAIILWAITGILVLVFLFTGTLKTFGIPKSAAEQQKAGLARYGIGSNGMRAIGLAELAGAATVWLWDFHWIGLVGAAGLVVITAGAIASHLRYDSVKDAIPAMVLFVLSGILLLFNLI